MRIIVGLIVALFVASPASAQNPTPAPLTGYQLQVFQNGSLVQGTGELALPLSAWTCGQAATPGTPPATITNPTRLEIDDPADKTHKCVTSQAAFFRALPTGTNYRAILFALSNVAQPPNDKSSALVVIPDFLVTPIYGPPAAPTGGRLLP
jgi:hypothetical protein